MDKNSALHKLIQITNKNFGYIPKTPSDFNNLGLEIQRKTSHTISLSSLKRIWGYVDYSSFPSPNTLNILARFNDYKNWEYFLENPDSPVTDDTSEYFSSSVIATDTLDEGDVLTLLWKPSKKCVIKYISNHKFCVIESENIKLKVNDIITLYTICVGLPLFITEIKRENDVIPGYIGAKNGGITMIQIGKNSAS